jgi:hypothetical protein
MSIYGRIKKGKFNFSKPKKKKRTNLAFEDYKILNFAEFCHGKKFTVKNTIFKKSLNQTYSKRIVNP